MSPSEKTNELTRTEWRELGFYYDRDDKLKQWRLIGSRGGLLRFVSLLREYVANPRNAVKSEHEHYGPYMYLEIMTWDRPGIDDHSIHGRLSDLVRLAELVEQLLASSKLEMTVSLGDQYVKDLKYDLVMEIREADFDPAAADPSLAG